MMNWFKRLFRRKETIEELQTKLMFATLEAKINESCQQMIIDAFNNSLYATQEATKAKIQAEIHRAKATKEFIEACDKLDKDSGAW